MSFYRVVSELRTLFDDNDDVVRVIVGLLEFEPRVRVISDVHLDHADNCLETVWQHLGDQIPLRPLDRQNEILVLAGDLGGAIDDRGGVNATYKELLQRFRARWEHVVMVSGNHEYYQPNRRSTDAIDGILAQMATETGVHFLQCQGVVIRGIRFFGCTLRTDPDIDEWNNMTDSRWLSWVEVRRIHHKHVEWLKAQLRAPSQMPTVVVTHHLPSQRLRHEKFARSRVRTAYVNNLEELIHQPKVQMWICGHSHEHVETLLNGVKLVVNPTGYVPETPRRISAVKTHMFTVPPILRPKRA